MYSAYTVPLSSVAFVLLPLKYYLISLNFFIWISFSNPLLSAFNGNLCVCAWETVFAHTHAERLLFIFGVIFSITAHKCRQQYISILMLPVLCGWVGVKVELQGAERVPWTSHLCCRLPSCFILSHFLSADSARDSWSGKHLCCCLLTHTHTNTMLLYVTQKNSFTGCAVKTKK